MDTEGRACTTSLHVGTAKAIQGYKNMYSTYIHTYTTHTHVFIHVHTAMYTTFVSTAYVLLYLIQILLGSVHSKYCNDIVSTESLS